MLCAAKKNLSPNSYHHRPFSASQPQLIQKICNSFNTLKLQNYVTDDLHRANYKAQKYYESPIYLLK